MADRPRVSIIVPTYNRADLLAETIASIVRQTLDDFECLVVDDASPEPVEAFDDERVRVIRRDVNEGPSAAINAGLDQARGEVIAFCDDDDLFTPDRLAIGFEGLERAPISICWSRWFDERPTPGRVLEGDVSDIILDGMTPSRGQVMVRAETLPRFDERFPAVEDVEWWIRLAAAARVTTVPKAGYLVRRHAGERGLTGSQNRIRFGEELFRLHAGYFAAHPRAAAFRWKRIGLIALANGDRSTARKAFFESLRRSPAARTAWHLARTFGPGS